MNGFWLNGSQWKHEADTVKGIYPDAEWDDVEDWEGATREWRLTIEPTPSDECLRYVLADLEAGKPVTVGDKGKVGHSTKCPTEGHATFAPALRLPQEKYFVSLTYPAAGRGQTWPAHPKVRLLVPDVARLSPTHPHFFRLLDSGDAWACAVSPQDGRWGWKSGGTVDYLDQVAVWLVKTQAWIATGGGLPWQGKWIGPASGHRPIEHLAAIEPTDPCWCGRGLGYGQCHRKAEIGQAIREGVFGQR